jgi:periplasmic protein CpxP/Spy
MFLRRASILSIALIALGGAVALAKPNPLFLQTFANNPDSPQQRQRQPKLMEQLNLNPDQKQKLKVIHEQYKDKISLKKQAVRQANQELRDLLAGTTTIEQLLSKHDQVQGLRQDLEKLTFESMLATREVLTPEQRLQFAQLMERRKNPRNQRNNPLGTQS